VLVGRGVIGYGFRKLSIDPAPLIVAVVLGPVMDKTLRQTRFMAHGRLATDGLPAPQSGAVRRGRARARRSADCRGVARRRAAVPTPVAGGR